MSQGKVSEKSGNLDMDIEWQPCTAEHCTGMLGKSERTTEHCKGILYKSERTAEDCTDTLS